MFLHPVHLSIIVSSVGGRHTMVTNLAGMLCIGQKTQHSY